MRRFYRACALILVAIALSAETQAADLHLEEAISLAIDNDPSLAALRAERDLRTSEGELQVSEFGPKLNMFAGALTEDTLDETRSGPIFGLEGRWSVYRGGQETLYRRLAAENVAALDFQIQAMTLEQTYRVKSLYFRGLAEKERLKLLRDEIELSESQRRGAKMRVNAGLATSTDELEFSLRDQELRADEIKARLEEKKILQELKLVLRSNPADDLRLSGSLSEYIGSDQSTAAVDKHPSLEAAKREKVRLGIEREIADASLKPDLTLYANVGRLNPVSMTSYDQNKPEVVAGLTLTVPLYDAGVRNLRAEIIQKSVLISERKTEALLLELQSEALRTQADREEIKAQRDLNSKRLVSAERYFRTTISEYELGVKNSPDVLGAMERWFAAKSRKIELNLQNLELQAKWERLHGTTKQ